MPRYEYNKVMEPIIEKALSLISPAYGEIRLEERVTTQIRYVGKELDDFSIRRMQGGSIRVYRKGKFGFATFTEPEELLKIAEKALKLSELGPQKPETWVPLGAHRAEIRPNLEIDPRKISLDEKEEIARRYNEILLKSGEKIQSTRVQYIESIVSQKFISTEGREITEERVHTGILISAISKDGTNIQRAFRTVGDQRGFGTVLGLEEEAENVAKEALDLLKAEKVQGGTYTVILDPEMAGVFIHEAFGHLSEADHIYRNEKLKELMALGRRIGPDFLNVVDDGTLLLERGGYSYDDEGHPSTRTYLIKNGILSGRLHSRQTAGLMGEDPTGNGRAINFKFPPIVRMSVTYIEPGTNSFEEMLEGIDRGLYVIGSLGGQTELEQFTFSARKAYLIENGRLGPLVRDVVLTGNVFETLKNIDMLSSELKLFGGTGGCGKRGQFPLPVSDGGPHVRIRGVVVGGR